MKVMRFFFLVFFLWGCEKQTPKFRLTDITGANVGGDFVLQAYDGSKKHLKDFQGKVVLLYFGYLNCPDICPTMLFKIKSALEKTREGVSPQVLFVTLDPERDPPSRLKGYLSHFGESFLGLWGNAEEVALAAKLWKVYYRKVGEGGSYTLDHSAGAYILDAQGRPRLYLSQEASAGDLAHDLRLLARPQ